MRIIFSFVVLFFCGNSLGQLIIDHNCVDLRQIPMEWIDSAKLKLHIAYGHTSHGSQITDGMSGLIDFTGGIGGDAYSWNDQGEWGNSLDLDDYAMDGDCGYYPQWVDNTKEYLNQSAHNDVNVIMWSWCGQISYYSEDDLLNKYILPMEELERDYPHIKFVYMTGHLNYWDYETTTARNEQLREYCRSHQKILYDFADIESYDPEGNFYEFANDNCDYYADLNNTYQGNWAKEWQDSHEEGKDWFQCGSAHSEPLNANQKAYAAWYLWA